MIYADTNFITRLYLERPETNVAENRMRDEQPCLPVTWLLRLETINSFEQAVLTGESLGGVVGFAFAALHPERVRTLSTLSAPLFIRPEIEKAFSFGHASWEEALGKMGSYEWGKKANAAAYPPKPGPDRDVLMHAVGISAQADMRTDWKEAA